MNISTIDHELLREVVVKSRRKNWLAKYRWLALFVGLPTLLSAVYYGLIASPIYVSQSTFVIKSPGQKGIPTLSLANLVQSNGLSSGQEQTKEVIGYMRSRDALRDLQAKLGLVQRFSRPGADFLSRYPRLFGERSFEGLYHYYGSMVSADVDGDSGMAVVEVRAFTPQDAYQINSELLDLSEQLVNRLNGRAEGRGIAEAESRVAQAEERLRNARVAMSAYRNQHELLDPGKQAAGVLEISDKLVADQAAMQAQLQLMLRVAPRNPAIPTLRSRIAAVGNQIAAQNGRAVGTPSGIASKLGAYEKLNVEQEFATQMLTSANVSLEQARAEAQKQQFYLERVVDPDKPDEPSLPHRLKRILTVLGASLCLYFIGWMFVVGILEHAPEN